MQEPIGVQNSGYSVCVQDMGESHSERPQIVSLEETRQAFPNLLAAIVTSPALNQQEEV